MAVSKSSPLIFERSKEGRYAYSLPKKEIDNGAVNKLLDDKFIRKNKLLNKRGSINEQKRNT